MSETLKDYFVSSARWVNNDDLEITLTHVPCPKYSITVNGDDNIDKVFALIRDRKSPVKDFIVDKDNNTLSVSPDIAINISKIQSEQ